MGTEPVARRAPHRAALLSLTLAAFAVGCRAPRAYVPAPGLYDRVPSEWRPELERARAAFEREEFARTQDVLRPLTEARPRVLPVRVFFQEAELAGFARGRRRPPGAPPRAATVEDEHPAESRVPDDPAFEEVRASLGEFYRHRAETSGSPADFVLAARLAPNGTRALELLAVALRIDRDCVWAHYGSAWWNAQLRRFPEARASIERAFALDGGHLPTMRLHASLQARAGDTAGAVQCLRLWLERTRGSPLVPPRDRAEAQVDLAALFVFSDRAEEALELLAAVDRSELGAPARADLVEASAQEQLGRRSLALAAAHRALEQSPGELLALVDEALLHQAAGEVEAEEATWRRFLDALDARTSTSGTVPEDEETLGLAWMLVRAQARARLARIERAAAREAGVEDRADDPGRAAPDAERAR